MKLPLKFENGGVTIPPGASLTSTSIVAASTGVGRGEMGNINNS